MTTIVDLVNNTISPTTAMLAPVSLAAGTTNSSAIDCISAVFPIAVFQNTGVFTAPGTLVTTMQEAKEDPANPGTPLSTDWTNVVPQTNYPAVFPTVSTSATKAGILVEQMTKRFLRAVCVVTGGGASLLVAIDAFAQAKITGSGQGFSNSPAL